MEIFFGVGVAIAIAVASGLLALRRLNQAGELSATAMLRPNPDPTQPPIRDILHESFPHEAQKKHVQGLILAAISGVALLIAAVSGKTTEGEILVGFLAFFLVVTALRSIWKLKRLGRTIF